MTAFDPKPTFAPEPAAADSVHSSAYPAAFLPKHSQNIHEKRLFQPPRHFCPSRRFST
jgi:hypothetical protein